MFVGRNFDVFDPTEKDSRSFDFVNDMVLGETISSVTWLCEVYSGTDASASSRPTGAPTISGTIVTQMFQGLLAGVVYRLTASVTTNTGRILNLWAHQGCETPS